MKEKNFYSHPGILLKDHLKVVGESVRAYLEKLEKFNSELSRLLDIGLIIGKSHDFGKYTSFFQSHLNGKKIGSKANHSFLSAIFGAYSVIKYLEKTSNSRSLLIEEKLEKFLPLLTFLVIYRHHGDLKSPEEIIPNKIELKDPEFKRMRTHIREEIENLREQIIDIRDNFEIISKELKDIGLDLDREFLEERKFLEVLERIDELRYELIENDSVDEKNRLRLYFITLLLFSALIDADKKSAGRDEIVKSKRRNIPPDLVDRYIFEKFKNSKDSLMNSIRREIYDKVVKKAYEAPIDQKLFTLTAPTGSGKTLTAFSFALKLRQRIFDAKGFCPRIIYSLPFINIIEQNYHTIKEVLSLIRDEFEKNQSAYLIKHHHLADLVYKENDEFRPIDEALLLIESWDSEIIITTFIQFLHSVIAFKNSFLKKFHNIAGSIIILDEVQNIPIEYWDLVNDVLIGLSDFLDCRIILMTATKPLLLKERALELLENNEKYFHKLNRVILKPKITKEFDSDDFIDTYRDKFENSSCLIVLNTIPKSIEIYNKIKEKLKYEGFTEFEENNGKICKFNLNQREVVERLIENYKNKKVIFYISTNITPLQRYYRIKLLKEFIRNGIKPILVSTQVVEAGVDLDFDIVFRDIGPLDSIIQVAGRCNRHYESKEPKEVFVIKLEDGKAEYVYGKVHLAVASNIIERRTKEINSEVIPESDFYSLISYYFPEVKDRVSDESEKIYGALISLNFYHSQLPNISEFKLIEEKGRFYDVFIEFDEESSKLRERFTEEVLKQKDISKRRVAYYELKRSFYEYVVSIRDKRLEKNLPIRISDSEIFFVPYQQLTTFYDVETGYKYLSSVEFI